MEFINIVKQNNNLLRVKTEWNELEIHIVDGKGIGIYLMTPKGTLIKQYSRPNVNTAINYILKKYTTLIN